MKRKCSKNLEAMSSYTELCLASSRAMLSLSLERGISLTVRSGRKGVSLHAETVESHPSRSISLSHGTTRGKLLGSIERTNVVQSQESSLKDVVASLVLAIDPPIKDYKIKIKEI